MDRIMRPPIEVVELEKDLEFKIQ